MDGIGAPWTHIAGKGAEGNPTPRLGEIRTLLAIAYAADPMMRWLFDTAAEPVHASAAWLSLFVERYLDGGRVTHVVTGEALEAVALWRAPGDVPRATPGLPSAAGLFTAFVGHARAEEVGAALHAIAALVPSEPHAYLHFLAVDPARHRRGLGARVVEAVIAQAADEGAGVHLETTNPDAVPFYLAQGFVVSAETTLAGDGPPIWGMWHAPAS